MTPLAANQTLDNYFLEARCKILDLAAILDRIVSYWLLVIRHSPSVTLVDE